MKKFILGLLLFPVLVNAQTTLPTLWNFSTPGIANPPVGWITGLGTNGNLTYSGAANSVGGDNIACRLDATGEYLTIWFAEKPGQLSYWLKGTGISPNPAFTGTFSVQESPDGANWTDMRSFTTANALTNTMTRFVNTPATSSRYVRFFYTAKESGSNVALDSVMIMAAPLPNALLQVKQNNTVLINGNTFVSGNAASTPFKLLNNGTTTDIHIDSIVLSGTNASDFSIGVFDSVIPFGGGQDSFNLLFSSGAPGSRFASATIYSTDQENSPFVINLYAIGGNVATEPAAQVPSLSISNIQTHAFNVSFGRAAGAEHYIVLRKPATSLTEVPVDGVSYKRGDYIGGAQVAYIGDDTTLFKPNYILSKTDYTFTAFSFNGPNGYQNYNTTSPAASSVTTPDGQPGNYYNSINPLAPTFIQDLNAKIRAIDTIFYSNYAPVMVNNYLARDTSGAQKVVTCVYSNDQYVYEDPFLWWTGTGGNPATLTREHTFAQSWMPTNTGPGWPNVGGRELPEYNDLHNLFPAHQLNANAKRSNNPFGVVVNPTYTAPTGMGTLGTDASGKTVYEPKDDQKGDLARALFYMLVRFNGINNVQWRLPANQDINILLQWHQQDPPSPLEIARNQYISTTQKNRNPFIDHPDWVNRINFSNMTYVPDPTAKLITVTAPNGGESFVSGTTQNIAWTSQNIDSVTIELKANDSIGWSTVGVAAAAQGSYAWSVPAVATATARIRVSEKTNTAIVDSSNAFFTILVPALTLTSPVGGENWTVSMPGAGGLVSWTSAHIDSVSVELYIADTLFSNIGTFAASLGSVQAVVLPIAPSTTKAKIKLSHPLYDIVSISPNYFNITNTVGVDEVLSKTAMTVYPNPSNGIVTLELNDLDIDKALITVTDITGRIILETSIEKQTTITFPDNGFYFIQLQTEKGALVYKIIVR